jgi:hypothetical protein
MSGRARRYLFGETQRHQSVSAGRVLCPESDRSDQPRPHECNGDEACAAAFGIVVGMSPTIFRDGAFRFFFFSREEERLHVHVQSPDGEAKFWIEPEIELARSYRLSDQDLKRVLELVIDHEQEIRNAWHRHFDR